MEDAKSSHQQMKTIVGESFRELRDRLEKEDEEDFIETLKEIEQKCFEEGMCEIMATAIDAQMGICAQERIKTMSKWFENVRPSGSVALELATGDSREPATRPAASASSPEPATRPATTTAAASSSRSTSDRDRSRSHSGHNRRRRSPAPEPGRLRVISFGEVLEELTELENKGTFEEVSVSDQEALSDAELRRAWCAKAEAALD